MIPPPLPAFSGAVLTGGASRRMGRDKALVEVGGRPLAVGVAEVLLDAGADEVFTVGGDLDALRALGLQALADDHPGEGPLGGLLTALRRASNAMVAVLACDLPALEPQVIRRVVAALDADTHAVCAVPVRDGRLEPLHGAWRRSGRPQLQAAFDQGERAMHRAVAPLAVVEVLGIDPAVLADANSPADLARGSGSAAW